jgi:hypothetical protein
MILIRVSSAAERDDRIDAVEVGALGMRVGLPALDRAGALDRLAIVVVLDD